MLPYIIPIILAIIVARIGRFCAATGSNRPAHWKKTWRCDAITELRSCGAICHRLRGHWGPHRNAPSGALGWYYTWTNDGKVFRIGLGDPHEIKENPSLGRGGTYV